MKDGTYVCHGSPVYGIFLGISSILILVCALELVSLIRNVQRIFFSKMSILIPMLASLIKYIIKTTNLNTNSYKMKNFNIIYKTVDVAALGVMVSLTTRVIEIE